MKMVLQKSAKRPNINLACIQKGNHIFLLGRGNLPILKSSMNATTIRMIATIRFMAFYLAFLVFNPGRKIVTQ
jgi:hypothetical protein